MFCVPVVAGVLAGRAMAVLMPEPAHVSETIAWWGVVIGAATGALLAVDRLARRFLPLAWLLRMALVFPSKAPRRWRLAVRTGTVRSLEAQLAAAREAGVADDATAAANQIITLITALQAHDRHTRGHAERVRVYTDMLTAELALPEADREKLRWAALLHDIGKLAVSQQLLNKPGRLDEEEWRHVHRHPENGARFCGPLLDWLGPWGATIAQHHERFDGGGYPAGLAGEDISLGARIVAVPDAYEVMTAPRPYKQVLSARAAREELADKAGTQFDPTVVRAFLNLSVRRLAWTAGPTAWLLQLPLVSASPKIDPVAAPLGLALLATLLFNLYSGGTTAQPPDVQEPAVVAAVEPADEPVSKAAVRAAAQTRRSKPDVVVDPAAPRKRAHNDRQADAPPRSGEDAVADPPPKQPKPAPTAPDDTKQREPKPHSPDPDPRDPPASEPVPRPAPAAAAPDTATVQTRDAVTIPVLANDAGDIDPSTLTVAVEPGHGAVTIVDGAAVYEAQPGWTGTDSWSYQVCGEDGGCTTATVSVIVVRAEPGSGPPSRDKDLPGRRRGLDKRG